MKFLLVIVVVAVVLWFLLRRDGRGGQRKPRDRAAGAKPMVRCAHCGLHLPADEAVSEGALPFCSEAHRLAHDDRA